MSYDVPKSEWSNTVRKRMAYANRRGVPTGPVPLGYLKVWRDGQTWVDVEETTALLVREAFRLAALKKQPLRGIVATLDGAGLVSKRGTPLSATALWRVLTNPFYCGTIRYAGTEMQGVHQPLVTQAEFEKVQERLTARRRNQRGEG